MNPSTKRANKRWQGSHVQGYAKALIHLHIENFQEDYTIQEIPKSLISTIRSDHIARFFGKKNIIKKMTIMLLQLMKSIQFIRIGLNNTLQIPYFIVWKIFLWI